MYLGAISKRYAKALLAFAEDCKEEDQVYKEMYSYSTMHMRYPELRDIYENSIISNEEKLKLLTIASGVNISDTTTRFLKFVIDKKRLPYILFIAVSYQNLYRKKKKIVLTELTTAQKLPDTVIEEVIQLVKNKYKQSTIQLDVKIDPTIIGGFILKAESRKIDASVSGELDKIKKELISK